MQVQATFLEMHRRARNRRARIGGLAARRISSVSEECPKFRHSAANCSTAQPTYSTSSVSERRDADCQYVRNISVRSYGHGVHGSSVEPNWYATCFFGGCLSRGTASHGRPHAPDLTGATCGARESTHRSASAEPNAQRTSMAGVIAIAVSAKHPRIRSSASTAPVHIHHEGHHGRDRHAARRIH